MGYYEELKKFLEQANTSNLKTKHYKSEYPNIKVKVSFGQGVSAKIPWISFLKEPNTTSHGIYPVYLYYKENNILILAYGISETTAPPNNWKDISSKQTINEFFATKFSKKPDRYGSSYIYKLGHMLKKTPDTLTMTSTYRHIISQTDFTTGLTRLDQQCNRTRTKTVDKNGKRKSPRFAFLKISASAHCTHLQSRSIQPAAQALQKSAILPTLKRQHQRS